MSCGFGFSCLWSILAVQIGTIEIVFGNMFVVPATKMSKHQYKLKIKKFLTKLKTNEYLNIKISPEISNKTHNK